MMKAMCEFFNCSRARLFSYSLILFSLLSSPSFAVNPEDFIERETAVIRILDKVSGRARTISAPVGVRTEFEKMEILVRSCLSTQPFAAQDDFMFVEILKRFAANTPHRRIFSGWMTASAPGDNPLQDSEYDLWLTECK
jgi:hypothetical protein